MIRMLVEYACGMMVFGLMGGVFVYALVTPEPVSPEVRRAAAEMKAELTRDCIEDRLALGQSVEDCG
jgi:hypothetical protein